MASRLRSKRGPRKIAAKRLPGKLTGTSVNGFPVRRIRVSDLDPADYNPRTISEGALEGLRTSVKTFGLPQAIVWNVRTRRIVGGHQRLKTLPPDSFTEVIRVDLDESKERALNLTLNNPHIMGRFTHDLGAILKDLEVEIPDLATALSLEDLHADIPDFGTPGEEGGESPGLSDNYTRKIEAPIYEPRGDRPDESELYDRTRTNALRKEIDKVKGLPDEVKRFLINAAERHTVFRFDRIAEYYAHAPAEVQDLMEKSALVVIDFKKAVELGYVKLTETMLEQAGISKRASEDGD